MNKQVQAFVGTVVLILLLTISVGASTLLEWQGPAHRLWSSGTGTYNYAPSVILDDNGSYHYWWCQNEVEFEVTDYIYYRNGRFDEGNWVLGHSSRALAPGAYGEWDSIHVCDPAIVRGRFSYADQEFLWAMFYLGTDQLDNNNNQIGVAFAESLEGPWVRFHDNPIITTPSSIVWGVGQPSVTSIDGEGRMLLFYTRGDANGTHVYRRELNFRDMDDPMIGKAVRVSDIGLQSRDGVSMNVFHNADFVYDPTTDNFFVVAPQHPFDEEVPSWVSSVVQIALIPGGDIWGGGGAWTVLGTIGPEESGKARNHNAAIVRSIYGTLPKPDQVQVVLSTGDVGENWLWSYTLYDMVGVLE